MTLAIGALALQASAFEVTVYIDHPEHAYLTASDGSRFTLSEGTNTLQVEERQNPVVLSNAPGGKLSQVMYNGNFLLPFAGPHTLNFQADDLLTVYTDPDTGMVTLAINGDAAAAEVRVNGASYTPGTLSVLKDSEVQICQRPGYVIEEVSIDPQIPMTCENGVWTFTASRNLNISIHSHADVEANVNINVDNRTNMTVTDALGEALQLKNGDNYLTLDPATQSPLTVKANPGASMEMVVCNGKMLFPEGETGIYTLYLDANGFNQIYLISKRDQTNTITVNVDDASRVTVSDANGVLDLTDGSNYLVFDFDNGNPVTVEANEGAILRGVSVDGDILEIQDNKVSFFVIRGSVVDIVTMADEPVDTGWIVLADEDFSGLTAGTEDAPATDVEIIDYYGYALPGAGFKPYHESCTDTWGGDRLYPAGGCIAVMGGFLNTPIGDYSGDLKMTFRARLVPGLGVNRHGLDVMLIRHSRLDEFKRTTYTLTPEWQEFTFTADNGWFYDTKIQFFNLDDTCYEIDDIKISHRITGIEPPVAQLADELTDNSFVATWYPTETADEYLLSVYEHGPSSEDYVMTEDFETVTVEDGHVTSLPAEWEYNFSANGDRKEYTDDPEFTGTGEMALCFDANGDYIITPSTDSTITQFSFFLAADTSDPGYDPNLGQVIAIAALTDGGWREWVNISVPALVQMYGGMTTVDLTENLGVYDNIYAFRLESVMHEWDRVLVYIDDIQYTVAGAPTPIYLIEDQVIEGQANTSYLVEGDDFDPEADYFYTVKARNSKYTSVPSNEIEVFHIHTPEALEATGATADSFTAHWNCGGKADAFVLTLYETQEVVADNENAVVLHEDFSKAKGKGTPFAPESKTPTYGYQSIDDFTDFPGWKASSFAVIDGMVGGMAENPDASPAPLAGAISTPVIDLSHDNGKCHVKVKGWFHAGDGLIIQGQNTASFAAIPTSADGEYLIETDIPLCGAQDVLTFYSPTYKDFMIDEITITQNLKAGDKIKKQTREIAVKDKTVRDLEVTGIGQYEFHTLSYDLHSQRYYHGNKDRVYESLNSNEVEVKLDYSAVENVNGGEGIAIYGGTGHILVSAPEAADVEIYNLDCAKVLDASAQAGLTRFEMHPGLYIVKIAGKGVKVQVR